MPVHRPDHPCSNGEDSPPDSRIVTARQAAFLADLGGVAADKLVGLTIGELEPILRWKIDPKLLFFQKVCGRVVKTNPVTGVEQGVPNATVHVEDTDCSFLGFFPVEGPWINYWWSWLTSCHREELTSVRTDACGKFCVWIPRFDIDRILRFRSERHCFFDVYKPTLRDVITRLDPDIVDGPRIHVGPVPEPDPILPQRDVLRQIGKLVGRPSLETLADAGAQRRFGEPIADLKAQLDAPAFAAPMPPPLADEHLQRLESVATRFDGSLELSPRKAIGPFLRCYDAIVAEWQHVVDIPDITFHVTQDIDNDGDEETIYSESLFDVRWNDGAIGPVTLQAEPFALSTPFCDAPVVACTNDPRISNVGLMPLAPAYHDNATGCATRVNRPHPLGLPVNPPSDPGHAPYAGVLELYGCNAIEGASYYRLLYRDASGAERPFTGLTWDLPTLNGVPTMWTVAPDADGWYPVLTDAQRDNLSHADLLLLWPTGAYVGRHEIRMELGDASKVTLPDPAGFSDTVAMLIDNQPPDVLISTISWRPQGTQAWTEVYNAPFTCIAIERPPHTAIEIEVVWGANAPHLRNASFTAGGCGAGNPEVPADLHMTQHWHTNPADNSVTKTTLCKLPGALPQGAYTLTAHACGRSFNPVAHPEGALSWVDWFIDPTDLPVWNVVNYALIDA